MRSLVQFKKGFVPYNVGEIAEFSDEKALWLVANGHADLYTRPKVSVEALGAHITESVIPTAPVNFGHVNSRMNRKMRRT